MIAVAALSYHSSCTNDQAVDPGVDTSCTNNGTDIMSYQNDIVPILSTTCTDPNFGDCHQDGSTLAPALTTYDAVALEIDAGLFDFYVLDEATASMPKAVTLGPTSLTPCQKEKLQLWVDQGYPDN